MEIYYIQYSGEDGYYPLPEEYQTREEVEEALKKCPFCGCADFWIEKYTPD